MTHVKPLAALLGLVAVGAAEPALAQVSGVPTDRLDPGLTTDAFFTQPSPWTPGHLSLSGGARLAAEEACAMAGLARARDVDLVELMATTPVEELILCEALGLDPTASAPALNPSGGALCAHPIMSTGLIRLGEVFRQLAGRAGTRAVPAARHAIAHAAQGHCLQQNIVWVLGRERRWT